jgi:hypothetical protein
MPASCSPSPRIDFRSFDAASSGAEGKAEVPLSTGDWRLSHNQAARPIEAFARAFTTVDMMRTVPFGDRQLPQSWQGVHTDGR